MAAVALDDPATTKAWIDFVFKPGELISEGAPARLSVTGGDVGPTLVDAVDRDGWGAESPVYNQIWIDEVARIADILDGYAGYSAVNLYKHPKFKALVNARPTLTMLGSYTPSIGDSGQVGSPAMLGTTEGYVSAFVRYRDPTLAQAAFKLNKNSSAGLHTGIFDTQPESAIAAIQQIVDARGPLRLSSRNLTGYGFAAMRGVTTTDGHEAFVYYGETADHTHRDDLMLDVFGFGLDLASPLGYPEFLDGRALTVDFQTNTISSNTVVVDKQPQVRQYTTTCQPRDFLVTPSVQMGGHRGAEGVSPNVALSQNDGDGCSRLDKYLLRGHLSGPRGIGARLLVPHHWLCGRCTRRVARRTTDGELCRRQHQSAGGQRSGGPKVVGVRVADDG